MMNRSVIERLKIELSKAFEELEGTFEIKSRLGVIYIKVPMINNILVVIKLDASTGKGNICSKHKADLFGNVYTASNIKGSNVEYHVERLEAKEIVQMYLKYRDTVFRLVAFNSMKGKYYI